MSKRAFRVVVIGVMVGALGVASYAVAGGGKRHLNAGILTGYEENPDISTVATGTFEARIVNESKIVYTLTYSGLEGDVQQAHIHFGKRAINGGVSAFLCSSLTTAPAGVQPCPQSGTVEGELVAGDVGQNDSVLAQGIEPGAFGELLAAMRAGHTYANVHSTKWPGGEIRAQIEDDSRGHGHRKHGDG
jgi:hypothetical protein